MSLWKIFVAISFASLALTFLAGLTVASLMAFRLIPFDGPPSYLFGGFLVSAWALVAAGLSGAASWAFATLRREPPQ